MILVMIRKQLTMTVEERRARKERLCYVCKEPLNKVRSDALTCSTRCRKIKHEGFVYTYVGGPIVIDWRGV